MSCACIINTCYKVIQNILMWIFRFFFPFVPVQCFENKQLYFANRLHEAMKVVTLLFSFFLLRCGEFEGQTLVFFFSLFCSFFFFFLLFGADVRSTSACESAILLQEHRIQSWWKLSYNSVASAAVVKYRTCATQVSADLCLSAQSKGAKEKIVTRIIVSRCEVDLKRVCSEYKASFGQSLQKTILVSLL